MILGIDHVVLACRDPDSAAEGVGRELGLAPGGGGRHERYGTFNRLIWLGDAYLELMGVFDATLAGGRSIGAATLALLGAGREGVAGFAVASDDIAADVARMRAGGAPYDDPMPGERVRPDGEVIRWWTALPTPGSGDGLPFLIEHELSGAEWGAAARQARAEAVQPFGGQAQLIRLELAVADPDGLADCYQAAFQIPSLRHSGGKADLVLGSGVIRLVPEGPGVPGATIVILATAGTGRSVELVGCRFEIEVASIP